LFDSVICLHEISLCHHYVRNFPQYSHIMKYRTYAIH